MYYVQLQMYRVRVYKNRQMIYSYRVQAENVSMAIGKVKDHIRGEWEDHPEYEIKARPAGHVGFWQ